MLGNGAETSEHAYLPAIDDEHIEMHANFFFHQEDVSYYLPIVGLHFSNKNRKYSNTAVIVSLIFCIVRKLVISNSFSYLFMIMSMKLHEETNVGYTNQISLRLTGKRVKHVTEIQQHNACKYFKLFSPKSN